MLHTDMMHNFCCEISEVGHQAARGRYYFSFPTTTRYAARAPRAYKLRRALVH